MINSDRLNPYEALGLLPGATLDEIKRSANRLVRELHPDRPNAKEKDPDGSRIRSVIEAYAVLRDPEQRALYDRAHGYTATSQPRASASASKREATHSSYVDHVFLDSRNRDMSWLEIQSLSQEPATISEAYVDDYRDIHGGPWGLHLRVAFNVCTSAGMYIGDPLEIRDLYSAFGVSKADSLVGKEVTTLNRGMLLQGITNLSSLQLEQELRASFIEEQPSPRLFGGLTRLFYRD